MLKDSLLWQYKKSKGTFAFSVAGHHKRELEICSSPSWKSSIIKHVLLVTRTWLLNWSSHVLQQWTNTVHWCYFASKTHLWRSYICVAISISRQQIAKHFFFKSLSSTLRRIPNGHSNEFIPQMYCEIFVSY